MKVRVYLPYFLCFCVVTSKLWECMYCVSYRRGPLVRTWAMRFEAKHHYFKNLVGKINNFKNIDLSLAKRHKALQAYLLQETFGNFSKSSLEQGPGKLKFYIYI